VASNFREETGFVQFVPDFLTVLSVVVAFPVAILLLEVLSALFLAGSKQPHRLDTLEQPRVAAVVPAHDESSGSLPTLEAIGAQLQEGDRLIVIADNCTDDTAAVAKSAGAEVIERNDPAHRGKGYALDFGLKHLAGNPPDVVIIIDADCRVSENAIETMAQACAATGRPVQILDLMTAPEGSPINTRVAEFAWRVKNLMRPLGLSAFGLPCQLMGTGMAFPYALLRDAKLASGALIEDVKLGFELARGRRPPLFVPSARVTSQFPFSTEAAKTQRRRWEEGNIRMILGEASRYAAVALATGNLGLLALALDQTVPPLSLLMMLVTGMAVITGIATLFGVSCVPFTITAASLGALVAAVTLAWLKYGRDVLPLRSIFSVVAYVLGKIPLYGRIFSSRKASSWVRTDRGKG
jgi:cellulose synthase/poly-beta-1,6-N-acetylglucosamine synthase-like glycosyltransferase